jgi:hemin uptake protein HemP
MPTSPLQPDHGPDSETVEMSGLGQPVGSDPTASMPKLVRFEALARCGDEIWIENQGQIYRLRRTRQGKLILTK